MIEEKRLSNECSEVPRVVRPIEVTRKVAKLETSTFVKFVVTMVT